MNALVAIHYPVFGGPHNRVLRLFGALAARGWQTIALLPDDPGNAAARLRSAGVPVAQVPLRRFRASLDPGLQLTFGLSFPGDVKRIRQQIRLHRADLVVVGGLVNPHAGIAARLEGVPVVWQIVDSRTPKLLRAALMPLVHRSADAVMFGGRALAELHLAGRPSSVPSYICPPPVDLDRFIPSPQRRQMTRRLWHIPDDAPVVGTVANVNPQKGIEYFLRAAFLIHRSQPTTWFLIVGAHYESHRRYRAQLEAEIRHSNVPRERFLIVGERHDVEAYYPAMDVKLITSVPRSEGTTTTAMEAMACEVPVVAADVGAVSEVVKHNRTGYLVRPLDALALAEKTLSLVRDPQRRAQLGAEARRQVQRFSIDSCADVYQDIFEVAVARRRGPRTSQLRPSPWSSKP